MVSKKLVDLEDPAQSIAAFETGNIEFHTVRTVV
jgi:hypothetical protein